METRLSVSRRVVALAPIVALAACASPAVVLDRSMLHDVRRVGVPAPGFPASPTVEVARSVGMQLGLFGVVASTVVRSNRADALAALMRTARFDPQAYFNQCLLEKVNSQGFIAQPEVGDRVRRDFLSNYDSAEGHDAILDVYVWQYGFTAQSDMDADPYRPAVCLEVRLVSARDRSMLMRDSVTLKGIDAPLAQPDGSVAQMEFKSFSEVTDRPDLAVAALRSAFDYAVKGIGKRLA